MEQPMTPSINRMIKLLTDQEQEYVTKDRVIQCESEVLKHFDFDFINISPFTFLERHLRVLHVHNEFAITSVSLDILKKLLGDVRVRSFKPSTVAAAAYAFAALSQSFGSIKIVSDYKNTLNALIDEVNKLHV